MLCQPFQFPNTPKYRWFTPTKIFLLLAVFIVLTGLKYAEKNNPDTSWIKNIVSKLEVTEYFLTVDVDGNLLITGYFTNKARFGTKSLVAVGSYDIFVAKYNPSGNLLWIKQAGGANFDMANAVRSDTLGNVYITGYFSGATFFDNYIVRSKAKHNTFSAKYSKDGELQWVQSEGAEIYSEVKGHKTKRLFSKHDD